MATARALREYLTLPTTPDPWVLQPLIPAGGIALLYGPPKKARKSYFALQMVHALTHGESFLGFPVPKPARVLFLQFDTPRSLWHLRLNKLAQDGVIWTPEAAERFWLADTDKHDGAPFPFDIRKPHCFAWLQREVSTAAADLVIIDVLRKVFSGSEDSSESMDPVLDLIKAACAPAAVLLITHAKKPNPDYSGGILNEIRGSSALPGSMDTILWLKPATQEHPHHRLEYTGRATEDAEILLDTEDTLFFNVWDDPYKRAVREALTRDWPSEREAARWIADQSGRSFETCRSAYKREKERRN